jgi:uncharacterized protein (TIGR02099 family)
MFNRIYRALRTLCFVLASLIVLVFAVAVLGLRYAIMPNIEGFKPQLLGYLQKNVGQTIAIDHLDANWDGWNPRFVMQGLQLKDASGRTVLRLPKVEQTLSWRSLFSLQLQSRNLIIDAPSVVIKRDKANRISVAGIEMAQSDGPTDTAVADWLLKQNAVLLNSAEILWIDEYRNAPPIALRGLNTRLLNSYGRHQLGLRAEWSDVVASPIEIKIDVTGDTLSDINEWSGRVWLRMDYADIARTRLWLPLPFPVQSGTGGFQAWFGFEKGKPNSVTADVMLSQVSAQVDANLLPVKLKSLEGRMEWTSTTPFLSQLTGVLSAEREQHSYSVQNLRFAIDNTAPQTINARATVRKSKQGEWLDSEAQFDQLDLQSAGRVLQSLPVAETVRSTLRQLNPRGAIGKTEVKWRGEPQAPKTYELKTQFKQIGIERVTPFPGVNGMSGNLTLTQRGGQLAITGDNSSVNYPEVFAESLLFNKLQLATEWSKAGEQISVDIKSAELMNDEIHLSLGGIWTGDGRSPGVADIKAQVHRGQAVTAYRYLPASLAEPVRFWLRDAVKAGSLRSAEIELKGELYHFPFVNDEHGRFRLNALLDDVDCHFADNWPEVKEADLKLSIQGSRISIDAQNAKTTGVALSNIKVGIPDALLKNPRLSIIGSAKPTAQQVLDYLEASPIAGYINHFTDDIEAKGSGALQLAIEMVLHKADVAVRGEYVFDNNEIQLSKDIPLLEAVNGKLLFSEKGISTRDLSAKILGGPALLSINTETKQPKVTGSGQADFALLRKLYPYPLVDQISGMADWQLDLDVTANGANFSISSSGDNMVLNAPQPLGKLVGEKRPLLLKRLVPYSQAGQPFETVGIDWGTNLHWQMQLRPNTTNTGRLLHSGMLSIGSQVYPAINPGISIKADTPQVDLDALLAYTLVQQKAAAAQSSAAEAGQLQLVDVDIKTDKLIILDHLFNKATLKAKPQKEAWLFDVQSQEAAGQLRWLPISPDTPDTGEVWLRLSRLSLPELVVRPAVSNATANGRVEAWPKLDLISEQYIHKGKPLGRLELLAKPTNKQWQIEKFLLDNPQATINATGAWQMEPNASTTRMDVNMKVNDAQAYLSRLGMPENLSAVPAAISGQLSWPGGPGDFDLNTVNGKFKLDAEAGRFTKIQPGAGKLLGILSLQSLQRRLSLDFKDLVQEGYSFDSITGDMQIQAGKLSTDNLQIVGPAANVEIKGFTQLSNETQQLDVRVLPQLSTSFAIGIGFATANPLIGAGVLLGQKVFKDPIERMLSSRLTITGTWSNPVVTDTAVLRESAKATAVPAAAVASPNKDSAKPATK